MLFDSVVDAWDTPVFPAGRELELGCAAPFCVEALAVELFGAATGLGLLGEESVACLRPEPGLGIEVRF